MYFRSTKIRVSPGVMNAKKQLEMNMKHTTGLMDEGLSVDNA